MKNFTTSLKKVSLLSLILFSTTLFGKGGNNNTSGQEDSLYTVEIDGRVLIPKGDLSKTYKIELLCHNTVIDSGVIVDDESFLLKVKKNSWYTVRIVKPGYFPQIVSIDTRMPEGNLNNYAFRFDTELIVENYAGIQDEDAIDFPIAIVSFNKKNEEFVHSKEYTKNIKSSLFDQPVLTNSVVKR